MIIRQHKYSAEDREETQAMRAFVTVLQHRGVQEGKDLDELFRIIADPRARRRDKLRAASLILKTRQQAAEAVASATGVREENLQAKGLSKNSVEHRHVVALADMDLERLRALALGVTTPASIVPALPDPEPVSVDPAKPATPSSDGAASPA